MVEDGGLGEVQVVEGEGVDHAVSGVEGPVRDVLVSGGGVGVAGVLLRDPVLFLSSDCSAKRGLSLGRGVLGISRDEADDNPRVREPGPCSRNQVKPKRSAIQW